MSITLIVSKFETGLEIRSLHITIRDEGPRTGAGSVAYGAWTPREAETAAAPHRARSERCSRLVVKVLSGLAAAGAGPDDLDLDRCARRLGADELASSPLERANEASAGDVATIEPPDRPSTSLYNLKIECGASDEAETSPGFLRNVHDEGYASHNFSLLSLVSTESLKNLQGRDRTTNREKTKHSIESISEFLTKKVASNLEIKQPTRSLTELVRDSPLEHSIEKVKENNARIMENIHRLNRTLDYTKKKEILDILCPKSVGSFACNVCGKSFVYESGLRRHSIRHIGGIAAPKWQTVWTCVECYQVWPRRDLVITHMEQCCAEAVHESARDIKTSSLLQCEFCEKVFTSIPQLVKHSKDHITARNYECNPCDMGFVSYRAAEQHWQVCSWLRQCYTFVLPKLLLCNVCDRKFRNYEHLYNHRYKARHFVYKIHFSRATVGTLEVIVYQCELCGLWYPSVPHLQSHRERVHPNHDVGQHYVYGNDGTEPSSFSQLLPPANNHRQIEDPRAPTHASIKYIIGKNNIAL